MQSSHNIYWERDELQDLYLEVHGAPVVGLGEVQSNGVTLNLVCVSIYYVPGSVVWVPQGFVYVTIVPLEMLQDSSLGLSHILNFACLVNYYIP